MRLIYQYDKRKFCMWPALCAFSDEYFLLVIDNMALLHYVKHIELRTELNGKFELDEEDQVEYTWTIK